MTDLLPCPFCGGEAELKHNKTWDQCGKLYDKRQSRQRFCCELCQKTWAMQHKRKQAKEPSYRAPSRRDKPVLRDGLERYDSVNDAAWELSTDGYAFAYAAASIVKCCDGKLKMTCGSTWEWAEDEE